MCHDPTMANYNLRPSEVRPTQLTVTGQSKVLRGDLVNLDVTP